jgi:hypothetical protein
MHVYYFEGNFENVVLVDQMVYYGLSLTNEFDQTLEQAVSFDPNHQPFGNKQKLICAIFLTLKYKQLSLLI